MQREKGSVNELAGLAVMEIHNTVRITTGHEAVLPSDTSGGVQECLINTHTT